MKGDSRTGEGALGAVHRQRKATGGNGEND